MSGPGPATATDALRDEPMRIRGLLAGASNGTFLVEVGRDAESTLAVYKPRSAEAPLWDFPDGTLCLREVAAFELASGLGWPNVPLTVLRDGPLGIGSVQRFVDHDPREHFFTLRAGRPAEFAPVAAFDVIVNNADRKGGHCLLADDGRIWLVDHGVSFHEEPKLRTVIWDFAGTPLPEDLRRRVAEAAAAIGGGEVGARLGELLSEREVRAAAERAGTLADDGRFPEPGPGRNVPWPPV